MKKHAIVIKLIPIVTSRSVIPVVHEAMNGLDPKTDEALEENKKYFRKIEMARRRKALWRKFLGEGDLLDKIAFIFDYLDTFF